MTNRLPEKLTALRKHFGYSQGDIAAKLQIPVAEYMNWENGSSICRIDQLRYLSSLYRVPIEDLASNVRTVTLPRLDEGDDSIDIAFGAKGSAIPSMKETMPLQAEIDPADNLISPGTPIEEPVYERPVHHQDITDTLEFEETTVNEIYDEPKEYKPPKKKPAPARETRPDPEPKPDRSRLYLIGGIAAAVLVFALVIGTLLGGRKGKTSVDISGVNRLALGGTFSMYLPSEGRLVTAGQNIPGLDSKNLVQVSAGTSWAMGLRSDGTVACSGAGNACKVDDWKDIVMIAAGESHSVGLKSDGTVVCNGSSGACSVSDWENVAAVYAGNEITIGITDKGTALVSGNFSSAEKIRALSGIRSVDIGSNQIAVTNSDGTVTCYAIGSSSTSNTTAWAGMSSAVTGGSFAAGLSNGRVTVATTDDEMVKTVSEWNNIQYIAARNNTLIAVNAKGTVIGAGDNTMKVYGENDDTSGPEESPEAEEKLTQPGNVRFNVTSANLQISWDPVAAADYYTVVVNTSPETSLKTEKPNASISTDKLRSGTSYVVTITACAKDSTKMKNSDPLVQAYQYEANLTRLPKPSGITCKQDNTDMKISWNPVAGADHYEVTVQEMTQNVTGTSIVLDMDGWASSDFTVYVTAYPSMNDTRYTYSETASATGTYKVNKTKLSEPRIVSAVPMQGNIWSLTWNEVDHAANYTVNINGSTQVVTENTIQVSGLADGEYEIQITANPSDLSKYEASVSKDRWTYTAVKEPEPTVSPEPTEQPTAEPEPEPQPEGDNTENAG